MTASFGKPFERLGGVLVDPAMSLPAALPLDLCGESVRARLCVFTDHNNRDLALRPDLTLSVALAEIEYRKDSAFTGERVQRYKARAFRQPVVADEPMEFVQVGFERFGAPASAAIDAQAYALVSEAAIEAGVGDGIARFGDLGILPGFIDLLELSGVTKAGLRRAFREEGGVRAFLARSESVTDDFVRGLNGLNRKEVEARVAEHLSTAGIAHFADRTASEVITRLMEQARDAEHGAVPELARETLQAVLDLRCKPDEAADLLRAIADKAGIGDGASGMLEVLEQRCALILKEAPRFLAAAEFSPSFGRRFTYYDGFVFEIAETGERRGRPFGAGGRYDHLLADLSQGAVDATAIGGVVRPDRLMLATGRETRA